MGGNQSSWKDYQDMMLKDQNVIIPDFGAAKYMYSDRNASGVPSPTPQVGWQRDPQLVQWDQQWPSQDVRDRLLAEQADNLSLRTQRTQQMQERADVYDRMRYHGMLEPKTMDDEGAEGTGTFTIGNETYILPTQVEGEKLDHEAAINRLLKTGEHLGVFDNLKDALFYERHYLNP